MVVVIVLCSTRKFYLLRKDPSSVASVAELATILSPKRWNLRTHTLPPPFCLPLISLIAHAYDGAAQEWKNLVRFEITAAAAAVASTASKSSSTSSISAAVQLGTAFQFISSLASVFQFCFVFSPCSCRPILILIERSPPSASSSLVFLPLPWSQKLGSKSCRHLPLYLKADQTNRRRVQISSVWLVFFLLILLWCLQSAVCSEHCFFPTEQ